MRRTVVTLVRNYVLSRECREDAKAMIRDWASLVELLRRCGYDCDLQIEVLDPEGLKVINMRLSRDGLYTIERLFENLLVTGKTFRITAILQLQTASGE